MAIISSNTFAKALWPGVNAWYGKAYNEYPVEWSKIFQTYKSSRQYEEDVGVASFGLAAVKSEGQPISYDTEKQGFTTRYTHVTYALGFIVTREAFDDDQYDVVASRKAKGLAFSMRQTKEIVAANVLNRAFTNTYTGGDGKELCATDHPSISGGAAQSNELATAADLSEAALEQAAIDIANFKNDRGLRIAVLPKRLIIPVDLQFEAARILKSDGRVGTDLNDMNVLKNMGIIPETAVNHYLTDSDAWFILTNAPEGMKHFERRGDSFDMDNDFDTENAKFKATARYSFGWTDWRGIYGTPGA